MIRLPPRSTRTDTRFPYATLFRSVRRSPPPSPGSSGPKSSWFLQNVQGDSLSINLPGAVRATRIPPSPSGTLRSEEQTSELQSLMRISYADFCLIKKTKQNAVTTTPYTNTTQNTCTLYQ